MSLPASRTKISTEQLIAICDEASALARVGVPIERNLRRLARELPGDVSKLVDEAGRQGEQGVPLERWLALDDLGVPDVFRAVLDVGVRSGRLAVALEGFASTARRALELSRSIRLALVYPMFVLAAVGVLSAGIVSQVGTTLSDSRSQQGIESSPAWFQWSMHISQWLSQWLWMLIPIAVVVSILWWVETRRAMSLQAPRAWTGIDRLPGVGRVIRLGRSATFADVLALLIEQQMPLPQAIVLSANACGDVTMRNEARELSERIARGEQGLVGAPHRHTAISPMVRWLFDSQHDAAKLADALRARARHDRRHAEYTANWIRWNLPAILTAVIGGGATLLYALSIFVPWYGTLREMANSL